MPSLLLPLAVLLVAHTTPARTSPPQDTLFELSCAVFPPNTTQADLVARFGAQNVTNAPVSGMDDGPSEGTIIFADRPDARVEIMWWDLHVKRYPYAIYVRTAGSRWRTPNGVTVGTDLRTLERANRRPFRMAGFSTESQGAVRSWAGGALDHAESDSCSTVIHLQPTYEATVDDTLFRQVRSGRDYSSGHPALQTINPRVVVIRLWFPPPREPAN